MNHQFEMRVGDRVVRAELLADKAPRICRAFAAAAPFDSFAVHAKFAGDELIVGVPFIAAAENEVSSVAPGDIGYYPNRQTLCLFYGDILPFASVTLFARVLPTDLPAARAIGESVLAAGPGATRIAMVAQSASATAVKSTNAAGSAESELAGRLAAATRAVWSSEPADVTRLRDFKRPPMGGMPCAVYANFDLFWLGENLQVCRTLAQAGGLSSQQAGLVTAALLRRGANRLSKWGFADTIALLETAATNLESAAGVAAQPASLHTALDALELHLGRVHSWLDAAIPWTALDPALRLLPTPLGASGR